MMNLSFRQHLQLRLSERLHEDFIISESRQVYGGDINTTYIIRSGNRRYFVKCNQAVLPGLFQKEYNGLQLLKEKSSLQVPAPLLAGQCNDTAYLVMECVEEAPFTMRSWQALGNGIAGIHSQTQPEFGLPEDNYIGSLPQSNHLSETWSDFYAGQRILPLIKKAFNGSLCTHEDVQNAEAICKKLPGILPPEPPALLHGDFWSGNVMACKNGEAAIYDPAAYYGHREMDIAMTLLFGGFDPVFYQSYEDVYPLQPSWQQRVALCQLYPLLVHLNLFGRSYYGRVKSVLGKYR